ncbi:MAG: hypothetical protein ACRER7_02480 [Gammaproteobacteria bacterium]
MEVTSSAQASRQSSAPLLGVLAVCAIVYVLDDLLHELGHAAATLLPVGVKLVLISTIGSTTVGHSPVVAIAGPLVNFALALALLAALAPNLSPVWRYFTWLLGTVNLFNATAYFLYSSILGTGDLAQVFNAVAVPGLWRPILGPIGAVLYIASILASLAILRRLCTSGVVAPANVNRYCFSTFWFGVLVLTAGAAFNPVSAWYILTVGAPTGLGMFGLLLLPLLLRRTRLTTTSTSESLRITWPWIIAGVIAIIVFVGIFGPGIRLGK